VNLYQTSSSGVPTAQPTAVPLAVAARTVPARGVPEVSVAAEQGASLVGWAETKVVRKESAINAQKSSGLFMMVDLLGQNIDLFTSIQSH